MGLATLIVIGCIAALGATDGPSRGNVWPKPRSVVKFHNDGFVIVSPNSFRFNVTHYKCSTLDDALVRYYKFLVLERQAGFTERIHFRTSTNDVPLGQVHIDPNATYRGKLETLEVELMAPCEHYPYFGMDEHYELRIDSPDLPYAAKLVSHSIWGILRGLETFVQLAAPSADGTALHMSSCMISDYPRFSHRGLLIDTARHFIPLETLYTLVDGMEASKLNTFHWHIVDDQSFPYQSSTFPELSDKGAYNPLSHVYTQNNVKALIEYCRIRGIRVIAEFDTPGHTRSWGDSHPELLTVCYDETGKPKPILGPMDPTKESTYKFIDKFFAELAEVFPDKYMHVGGDEVIKDCWKSNPDITKYMKMHNFTGYNQLESFYVDKAVQTIYALNKSTIVWQEVFDNGGTRLDRNTVVHIWKGNYPEELRKITAANYMTLLSSCWYLDHLGVDWKVMYKCDPQNFEGTPKQKRLVLGGEACMWSEVVDFTNVIPRVFPRASAAAERLWSDQTVKDIADASNRLDEFRCRLVRRGIHAEPSRGPGYCPGEIF
ncbi:beta-hexosaminidase subunit beta-like [Neocloeon triangulifer]|uniref:beta-hexosaminidase subunit beta-like n=1 Tax=Neocloeon triangulifer TaxID=2078957 RepID=UPI00286F87F1|nr:beta-hexosaminidase subunit beta-like [Neocloeon triangulifer]